MLEYLRANASLESLEALAAETITQLDKSLFAKLERDLAVSSEAHTTPPSTRTGTTAVLAMLRGSHLVVANTGDSRAVLCRGGHALALTSDQRPDREDERRRIKAAGGQITWQGVPRVNGSLAMTRAIGAFHMRAFGVIPTPEVREEALSPDDSFLVLGTDGIFDVMTNEEAVSTVSHTESPLAGAESLCDLALAYGSKDNVTAVVVPLPGWKSAPHAPKSTSTRNLTRPSR